MNTRIYEAAHALKGVSQENSDALDQATSSNYESVLHRAARAGEVEFVSEILRVRSPTLTSVDYKLDTTLDEASGGGDADVIHVLSEKETALSGEIIVGAAMGEVEAEQRSELWPESSAPVELERSVKSFSIYNSTPFLEIQTPKMAGRLTGSTRELRELHKDGIKNAANTVTVIAVLIATVTFAAIFTVPGGLENDGKHKGEAIKANTIAFKVFLLCDTVALFSSLMIVLILVTVVPFHRKSLVKLVFYCNKMMWVAVGCTASAFLAAGYVVVPPKDKWIAVSMCIVGGGSLAFMIFTLCWLVCTHQMKKAQLKRKKRIKFPGLSFSGRTGTRISDYSGLTFEACSEGGFHPFNIIGGTLFRMAFLLISVCIWFCARTL